MKSLSNKEMNAIRGKGAPSDSTSTKKVEKVEAPKDTIPPSPPPQSSGAYTKQDRI
jgi:hypothetical protein